jgi:hypothetical protein
LHTYLITKKGKDTEINTTKNILHNNEYNTNLVENLSPKQKQNAHNNPNTKKKKCVTFMYSSKEVRKITKLFREKIRVAFRTRNTIRNIQKPHKQTDKYNRNGIYEMKCPDFPPKYIGQTGRTLNI